MRAAVLLYLGYSRMFSDFSILVGFIWLEGRTHIGQRYMLGGERILEPDTPRRVPSYLMPDERCNVFD